MVCKGVRIESRLLIKFPVIQQYLILADDPPEGVCLRSVVANPRAFAWFSPERYIQPADNCTTYNDWRNGLENYQFTYHPDLLSTDESRDQVRIRYLTRPVHYLLGTADLSADDQSCGAKSQGAGHLERGLLFWKHITKSYPGPWIDTIQKLDFVGGVPHDKALMWKSKEGQAALFPVTASDEPPYDETPYDEPPSDESPSVY
jgi:hypothetical protein